MEVGSSEFTALEYPGYIRNVQKAIHTLGGEAFLGTSTSGGVVKLNFRPDEPLAHAIYGEKQPYKGLLLRISRPRSSPDSDPKLEILGSVSSVISFQGLSDFQFLPIDTSYTTRDSSNCPPANHPEKAEPSGVPEPLLCVPPLFSKSDVPFDYAFKQHQHKSRTTGMAHGVHDLCMAARARRKGPASNDLDVACCMQVHSQWLLACHQSASMPPMYQQQSALSRRWNWWQQQQARAQQLPHHYRKQGNR